MRGQERGGAGGAGGAGAGDGRAGDVVGASHPPTPDP